jgi:signal transduction histidine kinase
VTTVSRLPTALDVVRAAALTVAAIALSRVLRDGAGRPYDLLTVAVTVVACAPIVLWRVAPIPVALFAETVTAVGTMLGLSVAGALIVALALVGAASGHAEGRATTSIGVLSGIAVACAAAGTSDERPWPAAIGGFAVGMLPAILGERLRVERSRAEAATELAHRVEQLRDRDVERAVAEERLRIARDVHDITGHHLSAISLQAAGAGRTTDDPLARATFERIHRLTSEALGQTRRALGVLREDDDHGAPPAPPPRLAHVEPLLAPARAAGIAADLLVTGAVRDLPETVEMAAYRVVQESLTNVMRHARARSVRVVVEYGAAALRIAVDDDGRGGAVDGGGPPARGGSGIEGMRERLALVGGELSTGPAGPRGGWSVRAVVPLEAAR